MPEKTLSKICQIFESPDAQALLVRSGEVGFNLTNAEFGEINKSESLAQLAAQMKERSINLTLDEVMTRPSGQPKETASKKSVLVFSKKA